eukprot:3239002-Rhodomonas_salina.2
MGKEYSKDKMFDGSSETCWNSKELKLLVITSCCAVFCVEAQKICASHGVLDRAQARAIRRQHLERESREVLKFFLLGKASDNYAAI